MFMWVLILSSVGLDLRFCIVHCGTGCCRWWRRRYSIKGSFKRLMTCDDLIYWIVVVASFHVYLNLRENGKALFFRSFKFASHDSVL